MGIGHRVSQIFIITTPMPYLILQPPFWKIAAGAVACSAV